MEEHDKETSYKDKIFMFLVVVCAMSMLFMFYSWQSYKAVDNEYILKKEKMMRVKEKNKDIEKEIEEQNRKLDVSNVKRQSNQFYNLFFNWNSWQRYTENMNKIQNEFPQLVGNVPVDISGNVVGTGDSPISKYDVDYYISSTDGEVLAMVKQIRNTATTTTRTSWRGITKVNENSLLEVRELSAYNKIN